MNTHRLIGKQKNATPSHRSLERQTDSQRQCKNHRPPGPMHIYRHHRLFSRLVQHPVVAHPVGDMGKKLRSKDNTPDRLRAQR